ncbi:flagellar export protein FliJ [Geomonas sp. Red32]|uniref:flagellar export protein FliJ n=1 Tax=Geomonas sp. Red32 TaxID=2912856 RepID=UPI00202CC837|nr:flagellar export protein FliJ [Geomonas sp. Red32]MCM0081060.1 flagellar export protein FliJ [Geomonas sp. Red32]
MAGPEFRLEQVLKFRKEVERIQQLELAKARQQHENAREQLSNEKAALETLTEELAQRQASGIDAKDLQLYGAFARRKSREIEEMRRSVSMLEKAVQEKREALLTAAKEKKALEVFKEKKMRDLRMEQLLKERAFLDELAVQGRGERA